MKASSRGEYGSRTAQVSSPKIDAPAPSLLSAATTAPAACSSAVTAGSAKAARSAWATALDNGKRREDGGAINTMEG